MRITIFLATIFLFFSFHNLQAQSKPDMLVLTDGTVMRVVIRGQNTKENKIQYSLWESGSERIVSKDLSSVHKIVYSYGVEKEFNKLSADANSQDILDELFGGADQIQEEELSIPNVESAYLYLRDGTDTRLEDFSWTSGRLKLLRPKRFKKSRKSRYSSSYQPIPQWEEIELPYVQGILLPGRVRLQVINETMETVNDSTGWVEMRNGLKYAAQNIEIRGRKINFEEYYTKKVFKWDATDVNFLVWEDRSGGLDFLRPGESTIMDDGNDYMDTDSDSRGQEDGGGSSSEGDSNDSDNRNVMEYSLTGQASEFSPILFPIKEPSTKLRVGINPAKVSSSSSKRSLFAKGSSGDNIREVKARLSFLFNEKNYQDLQFFPIEGGFIMLTPVERFNSDGSSASFFKRFNIKAGSKSGENFEELVQDISFQEPGYYRMFAVAVTDLPRPYGGIAEKKINGSDSINDETADIRLNSKHNATFMVYEWSQVKSGEKAVLKSRGENKYSAYNHLNSAGILEIMKE